jgi:hypothetical protein
LEFVNMQKVSTQRCSQAPTLIIIKILVTVVK